MTTDCFQWEFRPISFFAPSLDIRRYSLKLQKKIQTKEYIG